LSPERSEGTEGEESLFVEPKKSFTSFRMTGIGGIITYLKNQSYFAIISSVKQEIFIKKGKVARRQDGKMAIGLSIAFGLSIDY